ncbi:acyl transferase domain-containing protein [Bisporella sp. PMI_857]|nr:acyl transferase domain-containing protein [Bisporella sp. PMI_857]
MSSSSEISFLSDTPFTTPCASPPQNYSSRASSTITASIHLAGLDFSFRIPSTLHARSSQLIQQYTKLYEAQGTPQTLLGLIIKFIRFITDAKKHVLDSEILTIVLVAFEQRYLLQDDVHCLANEEDVASINEDIIGIYYRACGITQRDPDSRIPALLRAADEGSVNLYTIFGGQGNTSTYFDDIRKLYSTYTHLVAEFLTSSAELLSTLSKDERCRKTFSHPLDILTWLRLPETTPAPETLISAPHSFPLIGLLQLLNYMVACKVAAETPCTFRRHLSGASGHSQGIIAAVVTAAADSWDSFEAMSHLAIITLFWIGVRSQQVYPQTMLSQAMIKDSVEQGEGVPTPMLSVRDLAQSRVQEQVDAANAYFPASEQVSIALINNSQNFVIAGPPKSLYGLSVKLRQSKVAFGISQAKLPFSKRKPVFSHSFLPITAPFHSKYLEPATALILDDVKDIIITGRSLRISVYHPATGQDLSRSDGNIVPDMVRMITEEVVDWSLPTKFRDATHILEFGPGGASGIGMLTSRNKDGCGVRTILADRQDGPSANVGYRPELFTRHSNNIIYGCDWTKAFAPRLIQTPIGSLVDTKLSRVLGLPPYIIGGMTPTTVAWDFVAAAMNAGYHIELAAGGYHRPADLEAALLKLVEAIPIGRGVTINVIYASPQAIAWQIPLLARLRSQGVPIDGLTIGAGVPSPEIAESYIKSIGLKHISFKPGSATAIEAVISIAKANPAFPVILQWTGGRGGGHHSYEDFHEPILATYGAIRQCPNLILVAGSGFGGPDDTYPYMTGDWSMKFGHQKMPFDGCLFGSRLMIAREAHTSHAAKIAIVNTPGVPEHEWEKTYKGPNGAGGVVTVISEMGEPMHMLATRGAKFWSEMDQMIFKLPSALRLEALKKNQQHIVNKLNTDFQRVWFGKDSDGQPVELEDMTYEEILSRTISLLLVNRTGEWEWIDSSYERFALDFIRRIEERFSRSKDSSLQIRITTSRDLPQQILDLVFNDYPKARDQLISSQDVEYFLQLCRRRGQKPVPFIPILDENFETYFKKDSLWQSEDLDAVVDQDVERTCILHGPVAAKYSISMDETIQTIMDRINHGHINRLTADQCDLISVAPGATLSWTRRGNKASTLDAISKFHQWTVSETEEKHVYRVPLADSDLPVTDSWLHLLAGSRRNWREILFLSDSVMRGNRYQPNPVKDIFVPVPGHIVEISNPNDPVNGFVALKKPCTERGEYVTIASVGFKNNKVLLCLWSRPSPTSGSTALPIHFTFNPMVGVTPLHEVLVDRKEKVRQFYWQTWFGSDSSYDSSVDASEVFTGDAVTITPESIQKFAHSIGYSGESSTGRAGAQIVAPIDYAIVIAWKAITKPLFCEALDGNLLELVHLSNEFKMVPGASPLIAGDTVFSMSRVTAVVNQESGRMVEVSGMIMRQNMPVIEVVSRFLFRGKYLSFDETFETKQEVPYKVKLSSMTDIAILASKPWLQLDIECPETELIDQSLEFRLSTTGYFNGKASYDLISTTGEVLLQRPSQHAIRVGSIKYKAGDVTSNEVMDYLVHFGMVIEQPIPLKNPIQIKCESGESHSLIAPASNEVYADASGDTNPIHVSHVFAQYSNLPGTITHGMWTSAAVRSLLEAADDHAGRVRNWNVSFVGMILPNDELTVQFQHVAMINGRKLINVKARKVATSELVLTGECQVDQPVSAYVFTGQGSQRKGMGMDLRDHSLVARVVWDRADNYFMETFGFTLTHIVKNDPKELTIHFGGPKGKRIRQNYMNLSQDATLPDGTPITTRLLPEITLRSKSYTFRSPIGLLSATQFTQPALTLMEIALFEDMASKGLVAPDASFAGHSLGEYSALAALGGGILPIEVPVAITFFRGLAMQLNVDRDANGRSEYSMCAINPSKIPTCDETALRDMVDRIGEQTGWLVEIVNFNIRDMQYICAGEIRALSLITDLANHLIAKRISPSKLSATDYTSLINILAVATEAKPKPLDYERGPATVPLKQIDVPFHSSFLEKNIASYRNFLRGMIKKEKVDASKLVGKWIPNITGKPFGIQKADFEELKKVTGSEYIDKVLKNWDGYETRR